MAGAEEHTRFTRLEIYRPQPRECEVSVAGPVRALSLEPVVCTLLQRGVCVNGIAFRVVPTNNATAVVVALECAVFVATSDNGEGSPRRSGPDIAPSFDGIQVICKKVCTNTVCAQVHFEPERAANVVCERILTQVRQD